jgi:hypothetical protein
MRKSMGIRSPQIELDQLYIVRDDLYSGKLASYTLGDKTVSLLDMKALNDRIAQVENMVTAETG